METYKKGQPSKDSTKVMMIYYFMLTCPGVGVLACVAMKSGSRNIPDGVPLCKPGPPACKCLTAYWVQQLFFADAFADALYGML